MEGLSVGTAQPHTETQEVEEKDEEKEVDVAKEDDIEESEDVEEIDMQAEAPHDDEDEGLGKENDESKIIGEDLIDLTADISKVESTEEEMRQDENSSLEDRLQGSETPRPWPLQLAWRAASLVAIVKPTETG